MIFTNQETPQPPAKKTPSRRPSAEAVVISNAKTHLWIDKDKYWTSIPRLELEKMISYVELLEVQIEALIESKSTETE